MRKQLYQVLSPPLNSKGLGTRLPPTNLISTAIVTNHYLEQKCYVKLYKSLFLIVHTSKWA